MISFPFDPISNLLVFTCEVEYIDIAIINMALDTGASTTIIRESILKRIGYNIDEITEKTTFGDASTSHIVPMVTLKSFSLADAKIENVEALCYTLPEEHGIDGVIGLNFLRHFKVTLDFGNGILYLERF